MNLIVIECPSCQKKGKLEIDEEAIKKSNRGVTAITVLENLICEHTFIAYIDKNLRVRDCFISDFSIEIPTIQMEEKKEKTGIPNAEDIDVFLISLNIKATWLANILKGVFYKEKILLINELLSLNRHIENFFNYIFANSYDFEIEFKDTAEYKKNKKNFKDFLVISATGVINDKKKIINPKKMDIEKRFVQKFLSETNPQSALIILKSEIQTSFQLAEDIISYSKTLGENEVLTIKRITEHLYEKYQKKILPTYIFFLLDVIRYYFGLELNTGDRVTEFLGFF
ncbi:MAG: hypothetical protein ACTSR8_07325 [Promethearchaeota archaeon]